MENNFLKIFSIQCNGPNNKWCHKILEIIKNPNYCCIGKCCFCYREDCICEDVPERHQTTNGSGVGNCKCFKGEDCECDNGWYDITDPLSCSCNLCAGCDNSPCTCDSRYDIILTRVKNFEYCIKRIIYDISKFKTRLKKSCNCISLAKKLEWK